MSEPVYVAIGSNLGDREAALAFGRRRLSELADTTLVAATAVYNRKNTGIQPARRCRYGCIEQSCGK